MASNTTARCIWLVDTLRRYGRASRHQIEQAWLRSGQGDGRPLSRRTFCNHRAAAEAMFGINIACDPATFEYYIENDSINDDSVTEMLLNSASMNEALTDARGITDRLFVENVPSAREHLPTFIAALRQCQRLRFDYHPYTRSMPTTGIEIEPLFLKLFKQRWYVVSRNVAEDAIKTYALDRMQRVVMLQEHFDPADSPVDPATYFSDSYGIVVTHSEPYKIVLRVDARQAKYFRALPLHHSQHETVADGYSLFTYRMRLTDDFVAELLSYGPKVAVLEPPELRAMMRRSLTASLAHYRQ